MPVGLGGMVSLVSRLVTRAGDSRIALELVERPFVEDVEVEFRGADLIPVEGGQIGGEVADIAEPVHDEPHP